jgi:hypothetical protein
VAQYSFVQAVSLASFGCSLAIPMLVTTDGRISDIGGVDKAVSSFKSRGSQWIWEIDKKLRFFTIFFLFPFLSTHPLDSADHYLAYYRVAFCHFSRGAVDVSCDYAVRRGITLVPLRTARVLFLHFLGGVRGARHFFRCKSEFVKVICSKTLPTIFLVWCN